MLSENIINDYFQLRKEYENNNISVSEVVQYFIKNINDNEDLNAFITVTDKEALESAKISETHFANKSPRKLEGLVVAVKDNISTKDISTTCASKILENYNPIYDATVIDRLKNEGAIIIGKTNLDEFAMGSSNENSFYGKVLNPVDKDYVPGGSSGGSAVAVAANMCHISLGSETGGSVRQPASFTGIYGMKPSYGAISRWGLIAFGSSLDQIGIFSRSLEENSLVFDVISGKDKNDPTSTQIENFNTLENINHKQDKLKIGILNEESLKFADFDVLKVYQNSMIKLEKAGYELIELNFDYAKVWIPTYYIISTAEASSNLSRYDGVLYGYRNESDSDDFIKKTRDTGFGSEVKRRILLGTYVLSAGHHEAYYLKALKARRKIKENYENMLQNVDLIFLPTTPTPAFKFGEKTDNPVKMYMSDIYTVAANLAGAPAISIPVDKNSNGLPIGLQVQTGRYEEEKLYQLSKQLSKIINT
ncbi:Asp-tRNA(Asn)/Glu-tRNA(Gln) amidotransferase subunit GatA [Candidatus Kapabacteria bacterium]|nr:Asp-tRNA(Asn)/Glu-tRNA(Gln) amidotransferase subunit GatA [Candidatus Kapabacteria bacterium]